MAERMMGIIRNFGRDKTPVQANGTLQMDAPHVLQAIDKLIEIFNTLNNKYDTYNALVKSDAQLYGAIDSKASFIAKMIDGFKLKLGKEASETEKQMLEDLENFHFLMQKYYYDIAFKVLKDGNAAYIKQFNSTGLFRLDYLPMHALTCIDSTDDLKGANGQDRQITKRVTYYLSEGDPQLEQHYPVAAVVHFDLGRFEQVEDAKGRITYNVFNESPLESLRSDMLWKTSIVINDMIWKERNVPREHHQLPSTAFNPTNFAGKTWKEKVEAARKAAGEAIEAYRRNITDPQNNKYIRADQGYITLDDVKIVPIEFKSTHNDPSNLIEQLNTNINKVYVPETAVSGSGGASFSTENAVMLYTTIKIEVVADAILRIVVDLAKEHLRSISGRGYSEEDLAKIRPRTVKILERHTLVRDAAVLIQTKCFTRDRILAILGEEPLTEDEKKEIDEMWATFGKSGTPNVGSIEEVAASAKNKTQPERPTTPQSEAEQQKT